MTSARQKGQKRRLRIVFAFVLLIFAWAGYTFYLQSDLISEKKQEYLAVKQKVEQEHKKHEELTYKVNRLHDRDYIGEIARSKYFMSNEGEIILIPAQ